MGSVYVDGIGRLSLDVTASVLDADRNGQRGMLVFWVDNLEVETETLTRVLIRLLFTEVRITNWVLWERPQVDVIEGVGRHKIVFCSSRNTRLFEYFDNEDEEEVEEERNGDRSFSMRPGKSDFGFIAKEANVTRNFGRRLQRHLKALQES